MALASKRISSGSSASPPHLLARFFSQSNKLYIQKVGIPEFLNGIGKGVESHVDKLEKEIGDFQKLLAIRTLRLKKFESPASIEN